MCTAPREPRDTGCPRCAPGIALKRVGTLSRATGPEGRPRCVYAGVVAARRDRSVDVRSGGATASWARHGAGSAFWKRSARTPRPVAQTRPADLSASPCLRRPKLLVVKGMRGRHAAHGAIGSLGRSAMRACAGRLRRPMLIAVACWWIREGQGVRCHWHRVGIRRRVPAPFRPPPPRIGSGATRPGHRAARRTPRGRSHPAEFPRSEDEGKQKL